MTLPKCIFCKYLIEDNDESEMRCKAFPDGIPKEFIGKNEDEECNNGIKFEEEQIPLAVMAGGIFVPIFRKGKVKSYDYYRNEAV